VPGQKTNTAVYRKNKRDLCGPHAGMVIGAVVPVIRTLARQSTVAAIASAQNCLSFTTSFTASFTQLPMRFPAQDTTSFVVASPITIGIVQVTDNTRHVEKATLPLGTSGD
jgi:uncharacterized membrane protein